jgi:hypothetical protein
MNEGVASLPNAILPERSRQEVAHLLKVRHAALAREESNEGSI